MAIYRLPPSPFVGGRQPLAPKDLNPAIEAVAEDNPPPKLSVAILSSIISTWNIPPNPQLQKYNKYPTEFVAEAIVPYTSQIYTILNSWIPVTPQFVKYPKLYQEYTPDAPPISLKNLYLNVILKSWIPPPPMPINPNAHVIPPTGNNIIIWMWKRIA